MSSRASLVVTFSAISHTLRLVMAKSAFVGPSDGRSGGHHGVGSMIRDRYRHRHTGGAHVVWSPKLTGEGARVISVPFPVMGNHVGAGAGVVGYHK